VSVAITAKYLDRKLVEVVHTPSGTKYRTAAPVDNAGDGSSFSPTDLVVAALGSCILTTIAIYCERKNLPCGPMNIQLEKQMIDSPRRIGAIPATLHFGKDTPADLRPVLERVAGTCPVHKSLHPDVIVTVTAIYDL
jgi:putative redox protein